jgi:hypothetical protein
LATSIHCDPNSRSRSVNLSSRSRLRSAVF